MRAGVPAVAVLALCSGAAVAAWPAGGTITAEPMPAATTAWSPSSTERSQGVSRDLTRPELQSLTSDDTESADPSDKSSKQKDSDSKKKDSDSKKSSPDKDESDRSKSDPDESTDADDEAGDEKDSEAKSEEPSEPKKSTEPKESAEPEETLPEPDLDVTGKRYTTVDLNVRTAPDESSKVITVLDTGTKVSVTETRADGFLQIVYDGDARWVSKDYLSKKKPEPPAEDEGGGGSGGISTAACSSGSGVESGLTSDAILVHRAICNRYPQVSSFGGTRATNDYHGTGQAVDAMISNSGVGWEIAEWVRANHQELGVSEIIYSQKIWTVQRGSEGWRWMPDRGSATANHYDHVHVSVYGNSATIG